MRRAKKIATSPAALALQETMSIPRAARAVVTSLILGLCLFACGPSVGEARLVSAPFKPPTCDLDFLELKIEDVAPGGKYELLGHVMLAQEGIRDPLNPKYRAQVRPRACAMGGEAVGILLMGRSMPGTFSAGGTSIDYAVVRLRRASAPGAPKKF